MMMIIIIILIDFNGVPICLGLVYAYRLKNLKLEIYSQGRLQKPIGFFLQIE